MKTGIEQSGILDHARVQVGGAYYEFGRAYFPFNFGSPMRFDRDNIMDPLSFARDVIGFSWTTRQFITEVLANSNHEPDRSLARKFENAIEDFSSDDLEDAGWKYIGGDNTYNFVYLGPYDVDWQVYRRPGTIGPSHYTFFMVHDGHSDARVGYTDRFVFYSDDARAIFDPLRCRANIRLYFSDNSYQDFYSRRIGELWSLYPNCDPHELHGAARQWGITLHAIAQTPEYQMAYGSAGAYDVILEEIAENLFERGNK